MKYTEDRKTFMAAVMDTPFGALAVKKRGANMATSDPSRDFGLIVSPYTAKVRSNMELRHLLASCREVTVRGHGWKSEGYEEAPFVWTGSVSEFYDTWLVD